MIYEAFKDKLLDVLRAPREPPKPPAGSPGQVEVFRADARFLKLRLAVAGVIFFVVLLAEFILTVIRVETAVTVLGLVSIPITVISAIVGYFLIRLDFDMRYYIVTDRSLRIREGALIIHEATFTYANIQNLSVLQGPLERLLGIANLQLETAGGAGSSRGERPSQLEMAFGKGHHGLLRGVANAREVRDRIMVLLRQYRDSGLGDPEERRSARPGLSPAAFERLRQIRDELRRS